MLQDTYQREITYMRISVTDRCNLRCVYCMPPEGVRWKPHENILTFEEIVEVLRAAVKLGVRSVRLTGGEPLVRSGIVHLVEMIAAIPQIEDISLTTNGILLDKKAEDLANAGLKRVNISIDTLDPEKYRRITRGGDIDKVWQGIEAAEKYGLTPIKTNSVIVRGLNDMEVIDLAKLSLEKPWHVRFIELMPINNQTPWGMEFPSIEEAYYSVREILEQLEPFGVSPVEKMVGRGPANDYRLEGGIGRIGLISPIGEHFCTTCNRLRLTADGNLRPCLLSNEEIPVLEAFREGEPVESLLQQAAASKPSGHRLGRIQFPGNRYMQEIGG